MTPLSYKGEKKISVAQVQMKTECKKSKNPVLKSSRPTSIVPAITTFIELRCIFDFSVTGLA